MGHLEARWNLHLRSFFEVYRAVQITTDSIQRYIESRQQEGAENATINRELSIIKAAFNVGRHSTPPKVNSVPHIPMLTESNTRKGFLESKQHDQLAAECAKVGLWLRAIFEVAYTCGWRHEELLGLRVQQVNLLTGTIRLEPGTTKNGDGREVTVTQFVRQLLVQCIQGKGQHDYVFTRDNGTPIRDFRKSWHNVCHAAGTPGLLFHDLRRSAARNLRNQGTEKVIMKIGGWRTASVF